MRSVVSSLTRHQLLCRLPFAPFAPSASSLLLPVRSKLLGAGYDMWRALRCNHAARMVSSSCTTCDATPRTNTKRPRNSSNCSHTSKAAQYAAAQHAATTTAVTNTTAVQLAQHCGLQQCSQAAATAATRSRLPSSAVVAVAAVADERGIGQQQQQQQRHMVWQLPGAVQLYVPLVTVNTNSSSSSSSRVSHTSSVSDSMHQEARISSSSSNSSRRRRKKLQGPDQEWQQQQQSAIQPMINAPVAADAVSPGAAAGVGARHGTQQPLSSALGTIADDPQQQQQQLQAATLYDSDCDPPNTLWQQQLAATIHNDSDPQTTWWRQQQQQQRVAEPIHSDGEEQPSVTCCEQQQQQQATKVLLLGIDPDTNGAVAVIVADLLPHPPAGSSSSSSDNLLTTHQSNGSNSKVKKHKNSNSTNSSWSQHIEGDQQNQQQWQQEELYVDLSGAVVSVYDMPVEAIPLRKKTKTSPQRFRRRLDVARTVATIKKIIHQQQHNIMQHTSGSLTAASSSTSNSSVSKLGDSQLTPDYTSSISIGHTSSSMEYSTSGSTTSSSSRDNTNSTTTTTSPSSSSSNHPSPSTLLNPKPLHPNPLKRTPLTPDPLNPTPQPIILRAILEVSSIVPTNGSLATLNLGFSLGAWTAALLALGVEISTVHVRQWKKDLGLLGCDKDASRQLAQKIFQQAGNNQDQLLSRKKDHGRAEALLIAAWGCGWSAADCSSSRKNKGSGRSGAKSKVPTSSDLISSSSSGGSSGGEDEATLSISCNSGQSGIMSLSPQQGPLREIIRMDGGMHLVGETDKVVSGSRSKASSCLSDVRDGIDSYDNDDLLLFGATAVVPAAAPRQKGKNNSRSSRNRLQQQEQEH